MVLQQQGAVTAAAEGGINQTGGRCAGPCGESGEGLPHLIGEYGEVGKGIHGPFLSGSDSGSGNGNGSGSGSGSGSGRVSDQKKVRAESKSSRRIVTIAQPKLTTLSFYQ
jgi:hypothetical protein